MKKLLFTPLILLSFFAFFGCDNTNIINDTCMVCHSDVNMQEVTQQFNQSAHKAGAAAVAYAGGRASCARCHSDEGFVEYAATGTVGEDISAPSAWRCKTCHNIHKTFEEEDYALRLDDPVAFIFDETVVADLGSSNLCANCHQSRRAEPNVTDPGATFEITSTHYGPHHGAQANVLYGAGFAEIAGTIAYPEAGSANHLVAGCTGCHMAEYGGGEGGHTWNPSLAACNSCHGSSDEDFNYGGVHNEIALLLEELRDLLLDAGVLEMDVETEEYHPVVGTYPMIEAQAFFNWDGLEKDRSHGAHNPKYVKALLTNTIAAL